MNLSGSDLVHNRGLAPMQSPPLLSKLFTCMADSPETLAPGVGSIAAQADVPSTGIVRCRYAPDFDALDRSAAAGSLSAVAAPKSAIEPGGRGR